jgi:hypothetical protein
VAYNNRSGQTEALNKVPDSVGQYSGVPSGINTTNELTGALRQISVRISQSRHVKAEGGVTDLRKRIGPINRPIARSGSRLPTSIQEQNADVVVGVAAR